MNKPQIIAAVLKNWKTALSGIMAAAAIWLHKYPSDFTHIPLIAHLIDVFEIGGLAGLGIFAKDATSLTKDDTK